MTKKSLACKIGLHRWFTDGALFYSAIRCGKCGKYEEAEAGEALEYVRSLWEKHKNLDFEEARKVVHNEFSDWYIEQHRV